MPNGPKGERRPADVVGNAVLIGRVDDPRDAPHPENLRWHRENVFGQALPLEAGPWA